MGPRLLVQLGQMIARRRRRGRRGGGAAGQSARREAAVVRRAGGEVAKHLIGLIDALGASASLSLLGGPRARNAVRVIAGHLLPVGALQLVGRGGAAHT